MFICQQLRYVYWGTLGIVLLFFANGCTPQEPELISLPTSASLALLPTSTPEVGTAVSPLILPSPTATAVIPITETISLEPEPTLEDPSLTTPIEEVLSEPIVYTVQDGDTSISIALQFNVNLDALMLANGIDNPNLLSIGQTLYIPPEQSSRSELQMPLYYVQEGDTYSSIAYKFNIGLDILQQANPQINPQSLPIGQAIFLPLNGIHIVGIGDTLSGIAYRYQVSLDDLFRENRGKIDPTNPGLVRAGEILIIPSEQVAEGYDCSPQPPRQAVIEYTVRLGERLFCLQEKFGISMTTILYANPTQIWGEGVLDAGTTLLIPPSDGALYTVAAADIENGITQTDLVGWYNVQRFDALTDWEGNAIAADLEEGQKIFIAGADLQAGSFQVAIVAPPSPNIANANTPSSPPNNASSDNTATENSPASASVAPSQSSGGDLWQNALLDYDTGYCPLVDGSGWTNSMGWPTDSRLIREGRSFRPNHPAIDIIGEIGEPIYAAEAGIVSWAGYSSWGGSNVIVLSHGNGWQTVYAHLNQASVRCGQSVGKGSVIGQLGQTGTGWPHLHFEVRQGANKQNPLDWLSGASFGLGNNTPFSNPSSTP